MINMSKRLVKIHCQSKDCLCKAQHSSLKDSWWSLKDGHVSERKCTCLLKDMGSPCLWSLYVFPKTAKMLKDNPHVFLMAPLAPVDLSQSNVEGNQLKHIFWITWKCTNRGFSSLRPTAGDYPVMPQSNVVYAILDNNGLQHPPSHCFLFQGKCFANANWCRSTPCPWSLSPPPSFKSQAE